MKRSLDVDVDSNKRARIEFEESNKSPANESTDVPINQTSKLSNHPIKKSSQSSKLLFYPFLLPLVVQFLHLRSILSLILVCKDIRPFVNNFIVHTNLTQEKANKLVDPKRYVTFRAVFVDEATSPDASMHPLLKFLKYDDEFNTPIEPGHLPANLVALILGNKFNQYMKPGTIPVKVQYVVLPFYWNQPVELGLFAHVQRLHFSDAFNHPLEPGCFSSKLTVLNLGVMFNHPLRVGIFPSTLQSLKMSKSFDHPLLPGVLPEGLKKLDLGTRFRHPINRDVLPNSLETLKLSTRYNLLIQPGDLPSSLTSLSFGELYDHPITAGTLPASIVSLSFSCGYRQMIFPGVIPSSVKTLVLGFNHLPQCLEPGSIPDTIESLELGYYFVNIDDAEFLNEASELDIPFDVIPLHIKSLLLHQLPFPGTIPDHIIKVEFGPRLNLNVPIGIIPDTVTTLVFGENFDQPIGIGSIPSSVNRLAFDFRFNQPLLSGMIPNSVTHLSFSHQFKQIITQDMLPDSVQFLNFALFFPASLLLIIPRGVTHLTLGQVTIEELTRILQLARASKVTHLSVMLMEGLLCHSPTRCFVRCEDGFIQHAVNDFLDLKDSSCWPPAPTCKIDVIGKILFSEIETSSLTADRFD